VRPILRPLSFSELLDRGLWLALRTLVPAGSAFAAAAVAGICGSYAVFRLGLYWQIGFTPSFILGLIPCGALLIAGLAADVTAQLDDYFGRRPSLRRMLACLRRTYLHAALVALIYTALLAILAASFYALRAASDWTIAQIALFDNDPWAKIQPALQLLLGLAAVAVQGFLYSIAAVTFIGCVGEWAPSGIYAWRRGWHLALGGRRALRTLRFSALLAFAGLAILFSLRFVDGAVLGVSGTDSLNGLAIGLLKISWALLYLYFTCGWFVVYYVDLRVRAEGLDLALQSEALGPAVAATTS